jgi:hypothetical protein
MDTEKEILLPIVASIDIDVNVMVAEHFWDRRFGTYYDP